MGLSVAPCVNRCAPYAYLRSRRSVATALIFARRMDQAFAVVVLNCGCDVVPVGEDTPSTVCVVENASSCDRSIHHSGAQ